MEGHNSEGLFKGSNVYWS